VSDPWGQPRQPQGGDWSVPQGGESGSGSFAPPPVDPQYGAPAPQYGAPQQPQPQYGAPQPQYGAQDAQYGGQPQFGGPIPPGGYGYPIAPQEQKNGFAVAGFVLSLLPLLGLIFSILGLSRAAKIGGKGKGLAIAGLVLSIAIGGGYAAIGVAVSKSTALDPGCTSAESSFRSILSKVQTDESKLGADTSDATAMKADLTAFTGDVQSMKSSLDSALTQAQHQSVKDKIQVMDTDLNTVLTGLQAIQSGDTSQLNAFEAAAGRLGADGNALDNVCSSL
jgi:hypothetical protein